ATSGTLRSLQNVPNPNPVIRKPLQPLLISAADAEQLFHDGPEVVARIGVVLFTLNRLGAGECAQDEDFSIARYYRAQTLGEQVRSDEACRLTGASGAWAG